VALVEQLVRCVVVLACGAHFAAFAISASISDRAA
jgi:hypothetical protein